MVNLHTKFEMPTITCNKYMMGNEKICNNSRFEPLFGGLMG